MENIIRINGLDGLNSINKYVDGNLVFQNINNMWVKNEYNKKGIRISQIDSFGNFRGNKIRKIIHIFMDYLK